MERVLKKYLQKLQEQQLADKEKATFLAIDAEIFSNKPLEGEVAELSKLFYSMNVNSLLFAEPSEPYKTMMNELTRDDYPLNQLCGTKRSHKKELSKRIVPVDCETRTFMHDIPLLEDFDCDSIKRALSLRKSALIKGRGIVTCGILTPEQAYVSYSSTCFSLFIKYFFDTLLYFQHCLQKGAKAEAEFVTNLQRIIEHSLIKGFIKKDEDYPENPSILDLLKYLSEKIKLTYSFPPSIFSIPHDEDSLMKILCDVGKLVVNYRLVDSYFGNISYKFGEKIFISQTGSSLDELQGHIEAVPLDGSSCIGITASSELPTHKKIYLLTSERAILHAHPLFSVIMSLYCDLITCKFYKDRDKCPVVCKEKREICSVPIVIGEIGTGKRGLVTTVPKRIAEKGSVIVYGHGVFTTGKETFLEPLEKMFEIEKNCQREYFKKLKECFLY